MELGERTRREAQFAASDAVARDLLAVLEVAEVLVQTFDEYQVALSRLGVESDVVDVHLRAVYARRRLQPAAAAGARRGAKRWGGQAG